MINQNRKIKLYPVLFILACILSFVLVTPYSKPGSQENSIKIGINEWTGYDPFILADKVGFFEKNNVSVEIKRFASATDEVEALKNGEIHGGGFTLDEAFSIIDSGFNSKIVLVVDYSMGGDMLVGQKEVTNTRQLVGKTIGFEGSVVGEFLLDRALRESHVKRNQVKLIDIQADEWLSAFKEKKIDALVCFNPIATRLLHDYEANLLFSSADMPFEIIDVLLFSASFYDSNQLAITNILKAWFETLQYITTDLEEAADIISIEKNISPKEYKTSLNDLISVDFETNKAIMDARSNENIYKYSQVIVDFMLTEGLLLQRINTDDIFQAEILFALDLDSES